FFWGRFQTGFSSLPSWCAYKKGAPKGPRWVVPVEQPKAQAVSRLQAGKEIPICFLHGHAPGKKHFSAGKCARQGARSGCKLLILGGASSQAGSPTPPRYRRVERSDRPP